MLITQFDHLHIGVLVLEEFEFDLFPSFFEFCESLLHFGFLFSLIGYFFNVFFEVLEVKVINVLENETLINYEVFTDFGADSVPVAVTHRLVS